jgi:hypothetical protein
MSWFSNKKEEEVKEPPFYRSFMEYLRQTGLGNIHSSYCYKEEYYNHCYDLGNNFADKSRSMSDKELYHAYMEYIEKYFHPNRGWSIDLPFIKGYNRSLYKDQLIKALKESYEADNKQGIDIDDLARRLEGKIKVSGSDNKDLEKKLNRVEQFTAGIMDKVNVLAELVDQKSDDHITAYLVAIMNKLGITEKCPICFKAQLLISLHEVKEGSSEHKVCQECKDKLTAKNVPARLQRCPICRVNLAGGYLMMYIQED